MTAELVQYELAVTRHHYRVNIDSIMYAVDYCNPKNFRFRNFHKNFSTSLILGALELSENFLLVNLTSARLQRSKILGVLEKQLYREVCSTYCMSDSLILVAISLNEYEIELD